MAVRCPGCNKEYSDGITLCAECGEVLTPGASAAGGNTDAVSRMFNQAKGNPGAVLNDRITPDAVEGLNKGQAVDVSFGNINTPDDLELQLKAFADVQYDDEIYEKHFGENQEEEENPDAGGLSIPVAESNPDVVYELPGSVAEAMALAEAAAKQQALAEDEAADKALKKSKKKKKEKKKKPPKQKKVKVKKQVAPTDSEDGETAVVEEVESVTFHITGEDDDDDDEAFRGPALVKVIVLMFSAILVSLCIGGIAVYLYIDWQFKNDVYDTAFDSVNAVAGTLPSTSRLMVYDVYVKNVGENVKECVINGVVLARPGEYELTYYYVIIDSGIATIFFPFDQQKHETLLAGTPADRISAEIMERDRRKYLVAMSEINSENEKWEAANANYINLQRLG